ncbi:Retrovirus-related Pol polyprotein from transposon opus [Ceratobasidium sp. AG-Ba]|nr:Retrovirus-related Pol polyprotein from transposon opus [Ceratobasidium sp. AG-Ba]
MANGSCVPSVGTGTAMIKYQGASWPIRFEVIDSRGAFDLLLGKDWLRMASASQLFHRDSLSLATPAGVIVVANENPRALSAKEIQQQEDPDPPISPAERLSKDSMQKPESEVKIEERPAEQLPNPGEFVPRRSSRLRRKAEGAEIQWVTESALLEVAGVDVADEEAPVMCSPEELWSAAILENEEEQMRGVMAVEEVTREVNNDALTNILDRADRNRERKAGPIDISLNEPVGNLKPLPQRAKPPVPDSERLSDPFKPERVAEIMSKIRIGDKLSEAQRSRVQDLIREFADVFARNLSEVLPVEFTQMKLDVPEGTTFPKRAGQKKFTEPQRQALYAMLDELEEAKIIERVNQDQVAAVSPINMVPKPGGAERPPLTTLQQMANSECRKYGLPIEHPEVGFYEEGAKRPLGQPAKWRLVQNFAAVNKVTQVRPFPMGDLGAKQQAVAGREFVSVM